MTENNSRQRLETAGRRRFANAAFWMVGIGAAMFVSVRGTTWVVATLNTMLVSTMAVAQTPPGVDLAPQAKLNAEVVKTADTYRRAVLAADAPAVAAMYVPDAIELAPCEPPMRGRAAIEQHYRDLFNGAVKVTAFTFSHIQSKIDGNVAYDVGIYERDLSLPSGQAITYAGKYLVILRRAQDHWKVAYAIYNVDSPAVPPCLSHR